MSNLTENIIYGVFLNQLNIQCREQYNNEPIISHCLLPFITYFYYKEKVNLPQRQFSP